MSAGDGRAGVVEEVVRHRHSERGPFDPDRPPTAAEIEAVVEAARWAPTAHNMQNFEIVVVDDPDVLGAVGQIPGGGSALFLRENYAQLSFSEEELAAKGTGLLATMFPPSWRVPDGRTDQTDMAHGFLDETMRAAPVVLIVLYDPGRRAPASEGDFLGIMSLGCVLQNMWLTAEALGLSVQVMSVFSGQGVEERVRALLGVPPDLRIAFALRLGHPAATPGHYLRVRRPLRRFVHRNAYTVGPGRSSLPTAPAR